MQIIRSTGKIMLSSAVFLAINGAIVFVFTSLLYDVPISPMLLLASFLITFAVYSLNMVTDSEEDSINRPSEIGNKKIYFLLSMICMLLGLTIGAFSGIYAFIVLFSPLLIGFLYSIKMSPSIPRLKNIVGVKNIVIALSWAVTGAFLPYIIYPVIYYQAMSVFSFIFVSIFVNSVIFDSLDVDGDSSMGIKTIPVMIGLDRTRTFLLTCNTFILLLIAFCLLTGAFPSFILPLVFGVAYGVFVILYFLKKPRPRLYAQLLVDGEWMYLLTLVVLLDLLKPQ